MCPSYGWYMVQTPKAPAGQVLRWTQLFFDLTSAGVDVRRLGFWRWLVENGRHPEWQLQPAAVGFSRAQANRGHRRRRTQRTSAAAVRP